MLVFYTDLDGTLLDDAYSFEAARPALREVARRRVPLVLCTSKTRAEVEEVRARLDIGDPFIVENGGALYVPEGVFPLPIDGAVYRGGYAVVEFGAPYAKGVGCLDRAAVASGCRVRGFSRMSISEIAAATGLSPEAAGRAKQREYTEPFEIIDGPAAGLLRAIEHAGMHWTRGGRFLHVQGPHDKASAVDRLHGLYRGVSDSVTGVGFGDGGNDAAFLNHVDISFLMDSAEIAELEKAVPRGRRAARGPAGWNVAALEVLEQYSGGPRQP